VRPTRLRAAGVQGADQDHPAVAAFEHAVIAGMLGYHSSHAELIAVQVGATWKRYVTAQATLALSG
jgi:hypothetical protein